VEQTQSFKPLVIAIVGPTASGKSDLGIEVALRFNGEVINCDSVQVYRRLYIATAKVPAEERRGVPHHLIDIVEPHENFTAGDFARAAAEKIAEIEARKRIAILVGGTGFYLRALVGGLFRGPKSDLQLRERLKDIQLRKGAPHLHRMLARLDREAAERIEANDWSRTTRALEVYFQTGKQISVWQKDMPAKPELAERIRIIALSPPRQSLYERINRRAEKMFQNGLVEEVKNLLASGVPETAKAFGAHGYRRVLAYLKGELSLEQAIEQTKLDTRHYAKRQLTWWRHQAEVAWFDGFGDAEETIKQVIIYVESLLKAAAA